MLFYIFFFRLFFYMYLSFSLTLFPLRLPFLFSVKATAEDITATTTLTTASLTDDSNNFYCTRTSARIS